MESVIVEEIMRAVIFDLDGVVRENNTNSKNGNYYNLKYNDIKYLKDIEIAHSFFYDAGYKIIWLTMQNCIKEGLITYQEVEDILDNMKTYFSMYGIDEIDYHIVVSEDESQESKIKAKTQELEHIKFHYGINYKESVAFGDRQADMISYKQADIRHRVQALNKFGDKKSSCANHTYSRTIVTAIKEIFKYTDLDKLFSPYKKVNKIWGTEYLITNNSAHNYCSKVLKVNPFHHSSIHYHKAKSETFTVLSGLVNINFNGSTVLCKKGDSIVIDAMTQHSFSGFYFPSYILETSNYHEDDDVVRLALST
jgi:histidinol phosphatase-like enzyme/quercetin dioxygenase-like cupin family protein